MINFTTMKLSPKTARSGRGMKLSARMILEYTQQIHFETRHSFCDMYVWIQQWSEIDPFSDLITHDAYVKLYLGKYDLHLMQT